MRIKAHSFADRTVGYIQEEPVKSVLNAATADANCSHEPCYAGGLLYVLRPWRLMTKSALTAGFIAR